jgi:hypothetical protein
MKKGRKKASDDEVLHAIYRVLHREGMIHSQTALQQFVLAELKNINSRYTIDAKRLRILALNSGYVGVNVHCFEEPKFGKKRLPACPVCTGKLKKLKNKTLYGGIVTLGYLCKRCSYWTGLKHRRPIRYEFYRIEKYARRRRRRGVTLWV